MNKRKRIQNRKNAKALYNNRLARTKCPNCDELGPHWVSMPTNLEDLVKNGGLNNGFWCCPKMYGSDGKRLAEYTDTKITIDANIGITVLIGMFKSNMRL